ncbi:uncharacterized protein ARMOST_20187 [Armillaria ostoyae]|uniref:Uncharacterized protein n=1 Tax=Armillaria ostoyae TaxID=47428 RepID=A0A284S6M7_ARMOS|nr:uncharacterized protein ARMOST_20187 [Armillaria ostoyae]
MTDASRVVEPTTRLLLAQDVSISNTHRYFEGLKWKLLIARMEERGHRTAIGIESTLRLPLLGTFPSGGHNLTTFSLYTTS